MIMYNLGVHFQGRFARSRSKVKGQGQIDRMKQVIYLLGSKA